MMRGVAILGIVLHNFCHWLGPIVKENEYTFSPHNTAVLDQVLGNPDVNLPLHLLSFFGHYGVPVFLFLSAFGLEKKYGSAQERVNPVAFTANHFSKLFRMMVIGFALFTAIDAMTPGSWHYTPAQVVGQLTLTNNLFASPDRNIWPGPYWFFGLMLQFYIVYIALIHRRHWGFTVALMVLCTVPEAFMGKESEALNWYRYNFMGGMLPFGLGVIYARFGERLIPPSTKNWELLFGVLVSAALCFAFSYVYILWLLAPALVCLNAALLARWLSNTAHTAWLTGPLLSAGSLSAALFVVHPITRKIFIPISRGGDFYVGLALYVVASVVLAMAIDRFLKRGKAQTEKP